MIKESFPGRYYHFKLYLLHNIASKYIELWWETDTLRETLAHVSKRLVDWAEQKIEKIQKIFIEGCRRRRESNTVAKDRYLCTWILTLKTIHSFQTYTPGSSPHGCTLAAASLMLITANNRKRAKLSKTEVPRQHGARSLPPPLITQGQGQWWVLWHSRLEQERLRAQEPNRTTWTLRHGWVSTRFPKTK